MVCWLGDGIAGNGSSDGEYHDQGFCGTLLVRRTHMEVSYNRGTPKSSILFIIVIIPKPPYYIFIFLSG
jgi:hypothetical protein